MPTGSCPRESGDGHDKKEPFRDTLSLGDDGSGPVKPVLYIEVKMYEKRE
jgi:hypothetical protein